MSFSEVTKEPSEKLAYVSTSSLRGSSTYGICSNVEKFCLRKWRQHCTCTRTGHSFTWPLRPLIPVEITTFSSHRLLHHVIIPAVVADDLSKFRLVLAVVRVVEHILVVTVMSGVAILGDQMHVEDSDVDTQARLAVPVEVGRLRRVGDVVGCFEVARTMQIFEDHVARRFHLHSCATQHRCRVRASIVFQRNRTIALWYYTSFQKGVDVWILFVYVVRLQSDVPASFVCSLLLVLQATTLFFNLVGLSNTVVDAESAGYIKS